MNTNELSAQHLNDRLHERNDQLNCDNDDLEARLAGLREQQAALLDLPLDFAERIAGLLHDIYRVGSPQYKRAARHHGISVEQFAAAVILGVVRAGVRDGTEART